jgi:DNA (cytosine-5)-methyltransferase 1
MPTTKPIQLLQPARIVNMSRSRIRVLDLFAGAGGLTAGFHKGSARFRSVTAVEMDSAAAASYEATFGEGIVFAGSIQDWLASHDMPKNVDVVVGGPPCQGFSTLGKQNEEDERNTLWEQYAKTLLRVTPKYFVVENVAAFAKSYQFQQFVEATKPGGFLEDYAFEHRILNSADFGASQARKRAVLIGHRRDLPFPGFPDPTHGDPMKGSGLQPYATVSDAIAQVPIAPDRDHLFAERSVEYGEHTYAGTFAPRDLHWSRNYTDLSLRRFSAIPEGGNRFDLKGDLLAPCWVKHTTGSGDVMGRLHWDKPSVTIRTEFFKPEKGRYLHPTANRAITHYEAALLQGFPETHQFVGSKTAIARQIGNAVPIPLGAAIGRQLAESL